MTGRLDGERRVAEAVAEREGRLDAARVVPAMPAEHALLVAQDPGVGWRVEERGRVLEAPRHGAGKPAAGLGDAGQHVGDAAAALLARVPAPQQRRARRRPRTGRRASPRPRRRPSAAAPRPPRGRAPPGGRAARGRRGRGPPSPSRCRGRRRPRPRRRRPQRRPRRSSSSGTSGGAIRSSTMRRACGLSEWASTTRSTGRPASRSTSSPTATPSTSSTASSPVLQLEAVGARDARA